MAHFIPGDAWRRPEHVTACAARSVEVKEAERDLQLHGLVAVQRDARAHLTCDLVHQNALQQFRIPSHALQVTRISNCSFLLRLHSLAARNAALARRSLDVGHTSLHLMKWGRQVGAAADVGKLFYRARVCLEGVPPHAHQVDSVMHLLPRQSFVEEVDLVRHNEDEKACFILWIWCKDPDAISVLGSLQIEEPMTIPEGYDNLSEEEQYGGPPSVVLRAEELRMLKYDVLIHLDRVEDYNPLPSSPSNGSYESHISGIPADEPMKEWPERHYFDWQLGQPDALPIPPRQSVHSRLGGRRDRSPPRDGGSGMGGFRQVPPPNQYDMSRSIFGDAGRCLGGNSRGVGYQGRQWKWQVKQAGNKGVSVDLSQPVQNISVNADPVLVERDCPPSAGLNPKLLKDDPMLDEVAHSLPMPLQRSVEPTATDRARVVSAMHPNIEQEGSSTKKQASTVSADKGVEALRVTAGAELEQAEANEVIQEGGTQAGGVSKEANQNGMVQNEVQKENVTAAIQVQCSGDHISSLGTTEPFFGDLFDLNQVCDDVDVSLPVLQPSQIEEGIEESWDPRITLGAADGRLNKQRKDLPAHKSGTRGIIKLTVPIKKSLLCNPAPKSKMHSKKDVTVDQIQNAKFTKGLAGSTERNLEDKATLLLMKASGIQGENGLITEEMHLKFGNQFVTPMQEEFIGDMRNTFDMPESAGADKFSILVGDAGTDDA
ncbi:unnamed protein product [Urochloa humidicola]